MMTCFKRVLKSIFIKSSEYKINHNILGLTSHPPSYSPGLFLFFFFSSSQMPLNNCPYLLPLIIFFLSLFSSGV